MVLTVAANDGTVTYYYYITDTFCLLHCTNTTHCSPANVLAALSCLMQEQSVLLLANDVSLLAPATEALLGMLSLCY
jgi:hypothetical protein